ncbi:glycosyltransferase [Bacillus sp. MRMR6]|nr:glycosyltransferase [Bacillus sp. MRMR6]
MNVKHNSENVFCLVLTKTRLYQGLALIQSLNKVMGEDYCIFIHCIDHESFTFFKKNKPKNCHVVPEKKFPKEILLLRKERQIHEYCWTMKPVLCEYILKKYRNVKRVTYLDSDLYFWENPRQIFENQPDCSVLLSIEEKYLPNLNTAVLRNRIKMTGLYNSGFISFKQDEMGLKAVKWWKEKCLETCKISTKEGLFGDQKYLDELPALFQKVCAIKTAGVNVGPWNYLKYQFSTHNDMIFIDHHLLIFYHFSGIRVTAKDNIQSVYQANWNLPLVYELYKKALNVVVDEVEKMDPSFNGFAGETDLQKYWN